MAQVVLQGAGLFSSLHPSLTAHRKPRTAASRAAQARLQGRGKQIPCQPSPGTAPAVGLEGLGGLRGASVRLVVQTRDEKMGFEDLYVPDRLNVNYASGQIKVVDRRGRW